MAESTYNSHERAGEPGGRLFKADEAKVYGRRFGVSGESLLFGDSSVGTFGGAQSEFRSQTTGPELVAVERLPVRMQSGGTVEAGAFRPIDEFGDDIPEPIEGLPEAGFERTPHYYFDVAGDSVNDLKPRPIMQGDRVIALDYESLHGRVPLRDGMVLIIEQTINDGLLRERSIKQLEMYEDRHEFHPRSTNKKHKPIVVIHDMEPEDGKMTRVLAWVRRVENTLEL